MSRPAITHYALGGAIGVVLLFSLFEVSLDPRFELPQDAQRVDPVQERRFADCFERRDKELHTHAFAMIDNPDVQREFIATERDAARRACREQYPEQLQTVRTPLRLKLLDFRLRHAD